MRSGRAGVALLVTLSVIAATPAASLDVPYLSGRVNDYADLLGPDAEERISARLEAFEAESGAQIAVLTIPTLEGESLEEFSLRVAETWGLGRENVDDGVLVLVARDDRKMRIEVGYGLEHLLTDAESGRILRNIMQPRFRNGDFDGGVEEAVEIIIGALRGADVVPTDAEPEVGSLPFRLGMFAFFFAVTSVFALSAIFSSGFGSWFLYLFLMPFYGIFPSALFHPKIGVAMLVAWIVGFPVLKFILRRTGFGKRWVKSHPQWGSWVSGGGGSGGGFSGGGFSGGGGSFGGGGASGSW